MQLRMDLLNLETEMTATRLSVMTAEIETEVAMAVETATEIGSDETAAETDAMETKS